ncbi:uncharacterized protein LOC124399435 isoform X1 [Silurus meridionalis]|uniref:uncharacterized protein LOC124399435 isoform X1 n=1 Tax=Silurus meridionalis TaxID=175797 RepID=UPI001EEC856C|nr:uncharacterized protein LOC124399435 isoform X1 [Silurus meridionalis]
MPSARNGENSSTPQRPLHRPACRRSRLFRVTEKRNVSLTSRNASHVFQALIDILPVVYHSFPSKPQANTTLDVKDGRWMTLLLTDLRIGTIGVIALRTYDSSGPSTSGLFEACRDTSCGYTGRTLKDSVMEIPAGLSVCPLTDLCSLSNGLKPCSHTLLSAAIEVLRLIILKCLFCRFGLDTEGQKSSSIFFRETSGDSCAPIQHGASWFGWNHTQYNNLIKESKHWQTFSLRECTVVPSCKGSPSTAQQ